MITTVAPDVNKHWVVTTPPEYEPITVDELKLFARIDGTEEDALLEGFIIGVREAAELYLGRALMTQTIRMVLDIWPETGILELPQPPLLSISQVATRDELGVETVYAASNYYVVTESIPGQLIIRNSCTPPSNTVRFTAGYIVDFIAGYGDDAEDVPQVIKEGLKVWATYVYEQRNLTLEPPPEARSLLNMFKVMRPINL